MSENALEEEILSAFVRERLRGIAPEYLSEDAARKVADEYMAWRMGLIASVERAAAEKAWREGELAGTRNQRDFQLYKNLKITDAEYKRREAGRANPYRTAALGLTAGPEGEKA